LPLTEKKTMRISLALSLLTAAALANLGCSGDTIVIIQQAPDTGAPVPAVDAADVPADAGPGVAVDATTADTDAGAPDATTPVDAGYDSGFNRLSDGGYAYDRDAALCGGRFVVMQMPAQDPMGLGRLLSPPDVMYTLKPSPALTQIEAEAWCQARGARLPTVAESSYLGAAGQTFNWCPQIWEGLADAGVGPCQMWLDFRRYSPWTDKFISSCYGGSERTGTAPRPTLCVYR
jgi:hypothetical protein